MWNSVGVGMPGLRLSAEEVKGLGKKLEDGTKKQHAMPDGKGGYIAMLEVFHMLHCLVSCLAVEHIMQILTPQTRTSYEKPFSTTTTTTAPATTPL